MVANITLEGVLPTSLHCICPLEPMLRACMRIAALLLQTPTLCQVFASPGSRNSCLPSEEELFVWASLKPGTLPALGNSRSDVVYAVSAGVVTISF